MVDLNLIFNTYGFRLGANNNDSLLYNNKKNQEVNLQTFAANHKHLGNLLSKNLLVSEVFKKVLPSTDSFKISDINLFVSSFQLPPEWLHIHPSILGMVKFTFDPIDSKLVPVIWKNVVFSSTAKMLTRGAMPASLFPEYHLKSTFIKDDASLLEQAGAEVFELLQKRTKDFDNVDITNLKEDIFNAFLLKANDENEYLNSIIKK